MVRVKEMTLEVAVANVVAARERRSRLVREKRVLDAKVEEAERGLREVMIRERAKHQ